jgi:hypothetical protein
VVNETDRDYGIDTGHRLRLMARYPDGSLTSPFEEETVAIETPIFIPAKHSGMITLEIKDKVERDAKSSEDEYHEQILARLNKLPFAGFEIFDEDNRYEISLPKWNTTVKPKS